MTDKSILDELKKEIRRSKLLGRKSVTHNRLEALIRMRETTTAGSDDHGFGNYEIRGGYVDAIQHDGTDERATLITLWVQGRGGTIIRRFSQYKSHNPDKNEYDAYLRIESPRQPDVVGPGWWVVYTEDKFFFTVPDLDFNILYVKRS